MSRVTFFTPRNAHLSDKLKTFSTSCDFVAKSEFDLMVYMKRMQPCLFEPGGVIPQMNFGRAVLQKMYCQHAARMRFPGSFQSYGMILRTAKLSDETQPKH
jgi:hypothetical protein